MISHLVSWHEKKKKKHKKTQTLQTKTYTQHREEEGDKEEEGPVAHATSRCHQEELLLGHLTYRPITRKKNKKKKNSLPRQPRCNSVTLPFYSAFQSTHLLWQCSSKSMMKVCQAFSLLSVSKAVGMRAKHSVITSKASQHTCSSSPSGSLAAFVWRQGEMHTDEKSIKI